MSGELQGQLFFFACYHIHKHNLTNGLVVDSTVGLNHVAQLSLKDNKLIGNCELFPADFSPSSYSQ